MGTARRSGRDDSKTRTALLDAAEQLILDEGYASVTSRRVAAQAGVNAGLVYYYFGTMDDLFLAVFRRRADATLQRQVAALSSDQPLWALWDVTHEQPATALNLEFLALGNHRKAIRAEIRRYARKFRKLQLEAVSRALERNAIDHDRWPASGVILFIDGMSRFLLTEQAYDLDFGHAEAVAIFERHFRELEGDRRRAGSAHPKGR